MRLNFFRILGSLLAVALISPIGLLFSIEPHHIAALTSTSANWADTETAATLFNRMQKLAWKVDKEAGPIAVQNSELSWQDEAGSLDRMKSQINEMGQDLMRLSEMRNKLEPWQQHLLNRMTPDVHEMVYQMDEALNTLDAHENRITLALTQYPQNIDQIYDSANQMSGTISTVTQYAHAEEKMPALNKLNATQAGS